MVLDKSVNEAATEFLTDLLLEDDKDALFESTWLEYELKNYSVQEYLGYLIGITTGLLIALGIVKHWGFLPIAVLPTIAKKIAYNKYKQSKKEELTKPVIRQEFKI